MPNEHEWYVAGDLTTASAWAGIARTYCAKLPADTALAALIARFIDTHPEEITQALDPEHAEAEKDEATGFLLFAIRQAVIDHALSDGEVRAIRHVGRLLRVQEGELLLHRQGEVRALLRREFERLLADKRIDVEEALHKVRLQEILGLGYDQLLALTAPEIERVILSLMRRLDVEQDRSGSDEALKQFAKRVADLDTVFGLDRDRASAHERSGYLYLLVNPSMPGLVKIGRTLRSPKERAAELTSATGVPTPFILLYEVFVNDAAAAERHVHAALEEIGARLAHNREFFTASPSQAVEAMHAARDAVLAL